MYLRRLKKTAPNHVLAHQNFLHSISILFKLKINPDKNQKKLLEIEGTIKDTKILPEKRWLLEKVKLFNK